MEKLLPQNIEAEQGVLGSLIIDPDAAAEVTDFLSAADFYRDSHRAIYEAITALHARREQADFITLCDELERRGRLEDAGGAGYVTSLINAVPTSGHVAYYGRIVERTAILRRIIHAAGNMAATAYESADAGAALDSAEQMLYSIRQARKARGGLVELADILAGCMTAIDEAATHRDETMGVPTGFRELDELLGGGLQRTELILAAGRPGMGKTSLCLNIADTAASRGKRVAIFSLEMGAKALGFRLLSGRTGIPTQRLRNGWLSDQDARRLIDAHEALERLPLSIDDTAGSPVLSIRNALRRKQAECRAPLDLVIVDFLQLMDAPVSDDEGNRRRYENRVQEIDKIAYGLKALAKDFDVPVLAAAQLSRAVEARQSKIPQLSDLRESGGLEMAADIVLFTYRDDYYTGKASNRPDMADIIVAKQRNGDVGEIELYWHGKSTRFFNSRAECEAQGW